MNYFAPFYPQALLLFLKEVEKLCIFTQKWLDHLLLMMSYLVTIDKRTVTENVRC